jgi:hypothetical protein
MSGSSSLPALGTLNRALTHITFASFPALNIGAQNMGKSFARINFEGDFNHQAEVAVGVVTSPEPYVMAVVNVGVLRSQALGAAWWTQLLKTSTLGTMTVYPDTTAFPSITISTTVVKMFDPDAYDGLDPVIKMVLRGVVYPNNNMWA